MSVDPCHVTVLSAVKNVEIDFGRFNQRRRLNWICVQRTGGLSTLCQHANKTQTRGVDLSSRPCPGAYYSIRVRQPDRQLCGSASRGARRPEQVAFRVGSHGRDCAATASVTFKGHISSDITDWRQKNIRFWEKNIRLWLMTLMKFRRLN